MFSFTICFIPSLILLYVISKDKYSFSHFLLPSVIGLISASLVCIYSKFFIFAPKPAVTGILDYTSEIFIHNTVSSIILYSIFLIISKDDSKYKSEAFLPIIGSYYSIYIPFCAMQGENRNSIFMAIATPILTISSLYFSQALINQIPEQINSKKIVPVILEIILITASFAITPVISALWYFRFSPTLYITLTVLCAVFSFLLWKFLSKLNKFSTIFE